MTLWASSFSSCSMGSSPGWPDSQKNVLVGCNAFWMTFKMSHQLNLWPLSLTFSIAEGICVAAEKAKRIYRYMRWVFLHIYRITRGSKHLTFPLLRFPLAHLIWFHFCWPGCTAHHNEQQLHKVCLKPSWSKEKVPKLDKNNLLLRLQLQSSHQTANPIQAGNISPWQRADEGWPEGLCCGWLTGKQQRTRHTKEKSADVIKLSATKYAHKAGHECLW